MEHYCESISKYHAESPEEASSDHDSPVHPEYPSSYADDAHYFDIDISLPFYPADTTPISSSDDNDGEYPSSYADDAHYFDIDISLPFYPADTTPISSSDDNDGEDEFELDFSICNANPPNPNPCISPAKNLFYQSQLLPLEIPTPPLDDIDKNIASPQSCNVPGVKIQFPNLLKTATKLKISLLGFRKSAKPGMDLQSPCAEYAGTGNAVEFHVPKQNRLFTVKLKVVKVPLVSRFSRGNSKGSKRDDNNIGFQKKSEDSDDGEGQCMNMQDRDKKGAKEMVQKYVKKIKPLYVKISQRSNDKISSGDLEKSRIKNGVKNGTCLGPRMEKQISFSYFSGNLKMAYKRLGKGKEAPSEMQQKLPMYSSESTLMELQSAIQGAIAHCKQSNYIHRL